MSAKIIIMVRLDKATDLEKIIKEKFPSAGLTNIDGATEFLTLTGDEVEEVIRMILGYEGAHQLKVE